MTLREAIYQGGLSLRTAGDAIGLSKTAMSRLVCDGVYPSRQPVERVQAEILSLLRARGVEDPVALPQAGVRPGMKRSYSPRPVEDYRVTEEIDLMQLDRSVLSHFGLKRNPFLNDVESDDDVFEWKGHKQTLDAIRDAIEERAFLAMVAPSGAGKTTIWDTIESQFAGRDDVVICRPAVKHKDMVTPDHLVYSLILGVLGDDARVPRNAEQRGRLLSRVLVQARNGVVDRKVVLVLDDAHYCNTHVLRQLKTFFEEKIGRYRLLTIVLIGLPALKEKLQRFPEIGNRIRLCEVAQVPVREYLEFKLKRVGSSLDKLFDGPGLEAFLARFRAPRRAALGWPLVINANVIRAMVKLYDSAPQPGERISRDVVDALPGGPALQYGKGE